MGVSSFPSHFQEILAIRSLQVTHVQLKLTAYKLIHYGLGEISNWQVLRFKSAVTCNILPVDYEDDFKHSVAILNKLSFSPTSHFVIENLGV